jgi:Protein of unknown function
MATPANDLIDELIISLITPNWQKVAMVIAKALRLSEDRGLEIGDHALAARIDALCTEGRVESQGNLSNWRHSEVRLPEKTN